MKIKLLLMCTKCPPYAEVLLLCALVTLWNWFNTHIFPAYFPQEVSVAENESPDH